MTKPRKCPICKKDRANAFWKNVGSWDITGKYDFAVCGNCGVIYSLSHLSKKNLNGLYQDLNYWGVTGAYSKKYWTDRADRDYGYLYSLIKDDDIGRVLDIGAGTGLFLYKLKLDGWKVLGTEVSQKVRSFSKKTFGVNLVAPEGINKVKYKKYFDLIILNNVIEHLPDPGKLMKSLKGVLKDGGEIIIVTPNSDGLGFKIFGKHWYHLDPGRHLYIFSRISLGILLENSGFHIEKTLHGYFTHDFAGIFESIRHLTKHGNQKANTVNANNNGSDSQNIFKLLFKSASYIISAALAYLEKYIGRGEVITVYAKNNNISNHS